MLASHSYLVAGLRLTLLLPADFDVIRGLPNFRDFAAESYRLSGRTADVKTDDGPEAEAPADCGDVADGPAASGDPALILQWVEDLTLPSGAETLFSEDSDMGRTTYFSCGGESWFSLDFIGCKALMRVSEDYRKAVFAVDTSAPTAGIVISSLSRALFAQIVLLHDGISVHSSCVVRDGKAYMFLGRSGTGKSTHSRLWIEAFPGTELLNDDNPAVRILPDGPRVFGTPWSGKTDCWRNLSAPLCGIVRLRQAPFDSFEPLDGIQAFSEVYPGCSVLRSDAFLHERLCDNLEMLCSLVKVGRMACLPDLEAARICAAGIATL